MSLSGPMLYCKQYEPRSDICLWAHTESKSGVHFNICSRQNFYVKKLWQNKDKHRHKTVY